MAKYDVKNEYGEKIGEIRSVPDYEQRAAEAAAGGILAGAGILALGVLLGGWFVVRWFISHTTPRGLVGIGIGIVPFLVQAYYSSGSLHKSPRWLERSNSHQLTSGTQSVFLVLIFAGIAIWCFGALTFRPSTSTTSPPFLREKPWLAFLVIQGVVLMVVVVALIFLAWDYQ